MTTQLEVRFASNTPHKVAEAAEILAPRGIVVIPVTMKIEELQTKDTKRLIHDKLLKAFERVGRPLFVEHNGIYMSEAGDLPGGLTQVFWDSLDAERFARLFGSRLSVPAHAIARCFIAYCDGKKIFDFGAEMPGQITEVPRGSRELQWDCVFQPDGESETFAEISERKGEIVMRRAALDQLADHLLEHQDT
jgi:XTP/dITP diphosphohydrolase